jgi:hypothetical protein
LVLPENEKYNTKTDVGLKLMMSELGAEVARIRLKLEYAFGKRSGEEALRVDELIESKCPYRISDLDISGADLLSLGLKGSAVGSAMKSLLLGVIEGKVENKRAALISKLLASEVKEGK